MFRILYLYLSLVVAAGVFPPAAVHAQDAGAPCGRDDQGEPLVCTRPDAGATLESACLTTARPENCVPYHRTSCEVRGFAVACRLYSMGANCFGGDQQTCSFYMSLLQANTACVLNRDPSACAYLQQQGF